MSDSVVIIRYDTNTCKLVLLFVISCTLTSNSNYQSLINV